MKKALVLGIATVLGLSLWGGSTFRRAPIKPIHDTTYTMNHGGRNFYLTIAGNQASFLWNGRSLEVRSMNDQRLGMFCWPNTQTDKEFTFGLVKSTRVIEPGYASTASSSTHLTLQPGQSLIY